MQSINNNHYNMPLSFQSIKIPYTANKNLPLVTPLKQIRPRFELKGFMSKETSQVRDIIKNEQVGVLAKDDALFLIGKNKNIEDFISGQMSKAEIKHTYIKDAPTTTVKFDA